VAAGHHLARGPQGYRFRGDLYSQESTFPLVKACGLFLCNVWKSLILEFNTVTVVTFNSIGVLNS